MPAQPRRPVHPAHQHGPPQAHCTVPRPGRHPPEQPPQQRPVFEQPELREGPRLHARVEVWVHPRHVQGAEVRRRPGPRCGSGLAFQPRGAEGEKGRERRGFPRHNIAPIIIIFDSPTVQPQPQPPQLSGNKFGPYPCPYLFNAIKKLPKLSTVKLRGCYIGFKGSEVRE